MRRVELPDHGHGLGRHLGRQPEGHQHPTGRLLSLAQHGSGPVAVRAGAVGPDLDQAGDPGDVQHQSDRRAGIVYDDRFGGLAGVAVHRQQSGETGGVHERRVAQVDLDALTAVQGGGQCCTELGGRGQVDVTANDHHRGTVAVDHFGGEDQAFGLLVRASQRENTKLRDIARRIVDNAIARHRTVAAGSEGASDDER